MNKRIRELAKQAMVTIPAVEGPLSHTYFDREKFAELIVRECVKVVDAGIDPAESHLPGDDIKQHFGVEESKQEKFSQAIKTAFEGGIDLSGQDTP